MTVGERINQRLRDMNKSQSWLARTVNLTQPTISALIRGESRSSAHLHRIARALKTTSAWLNSDTEDLGDDFGAAVLNEDEQELLDLFREMDKIQQQAFIGMGRSVVPSARSSTVHAPAQNYRANHAISDQQRPLELQALQGAIAEAMEAGMPRKKDAQIQYLAEVVYEILQLPAHLATSSDIPADGGEGGIEAGVPASSATRRASQR